MGDDAVHLVQVALQLADNSIGVDRRLVGIQNLFPVGHPLVFQFGNLGRHLGLVPSAILANLRSHFLNHCLQG